MDNIHGLLKIENMDKLSGRTIGLDFIVSKMVYNRATYLIFLNDMLGSHKRDLKLHLPYLPRIDTHQLTKYPHLFHFGVQNLQRVMLPIRVNGL